MYQYETMSRAEQICYFMKRIYDADMTTLTGGNISLRDENGVVWMTPTSIDKAALTPEDIVRIYPDGHYEGLHRPTSEYRIHMGIYHARPDIMAIIHAHSPAMIAMSLLHRVPDRRLSASAWKQTGPAVVVPYAIPGTAKLGENVTKAFADGADFTILENHGCFVGSETDMADCFKRFEAFDFCARLELQARAAGELHPAEEQTLKKLSDGFADTVREGAAAQADCDALKQTLAAICRRAYRKKMFTAATGAVSARCGGNQFVISTADKDNGCMDAEHLTLVADGLYEAGKQPDLTVGIHKAIYEAVPEIGAIIFAAPTEAMVSAVTDADYRVDMIPESYGVLRGCVRCRAEELLAEPEKYCSQFGIKKPFLMVENYGLFLAAANPVMAFDKLEVCEYSAQEYHVCVRSRQQVMCMSMKDLIEAND